VINAQFFSAEYGNVITKKFGLRKRLMKRFRLGALSFGFPAKVFMEKDNILGLRSLDPLESSDQRANFLSIRFIPLLKNLSLIIKIDEVGSSPSVKPAKKAWRDQGLKQLSLFAVESFGDI